MSLTKVSYSMIKGAPFNVLDYWDGSDDWTASIQAAIDAAGVAGGGTVIVPEGTYALTFLVMDLPGVTLRGEGRYSIFQSTQSFTTGHRPTIWIAADNCTVDSLYFTYANWISADLTSLLTSRPAVNSYFGCHIAVGYEDLYTSASSGVYNTLYGVTLSVLHNTTIRNNTILGTAVHAIALFNAFNTQVTGNNIQQFKATGIYAIICPNTLVENNYLETSGDDAIFIGSSTGRIDGVWTPITTEESTNVKVIGNYCKKIGAKGCAVSGYTGVVISNNVVDESRVSAIWCGAELFANSGPVFYAQITGNTLKDCFGGFGTPADGYYYVDDVYSSVGGSYFAIELSRSYQTSVVGNTTNLSTKVTDANAQQALRGFGSIQSFKRSVIANNIFNGFIRNNLGPESSGEPFNPSQIIVTNNIFDTLAIPIANPARLIQIGVDADAININNNTFTSDCSPAASFAIIYGLTGSRTIANNNTFVLPNAIAKYAKEGGNTLLLATSDTVDTAVGADIETTSYPARVYRSTAAPIAGTWAVGDIVYNTTPASAGYAGWICTVDGTPGTWETFGLIS